MSDIDRAEQATAELREAIREARGMVKDLTQLLREARTLTRDTVTGELDAQMTEMRRKTEAAMDAAVDRINASFETLGERLLQHDQRSRRMGLPTLDEVVDAAAAGATIHPGKRQLAVDTDVLDGRPR